MAKTLVRAVRTMSQLQHVANGLHRLILLHFVNSSPTRLLQLVANKRTQNVGQNVGQIWLEDLTGFQRHR